MKTFKANINESAKIISGQNEKDKEPTYKRRRHESIDSQESIPNKPKKSRKDSNSEGQKADSNPEGQKADSNLEEREEDMEEKTGDVLLIDVDDQEKKDSNLEEDREEGEQNVEEKTGDGDDQEKKDSDVEDVDDQEKKDSDVEDVEEKTGDDHKHDDKEYIDEMETGEATENLDEDAAEIDAVQKITAKSSNDEDHYTSIN